MNRKMERRKQEDEIIALTLLKTLLVAYLCTGVFLLLMALLVYKAGISEKTVSIGIIIIYIGASFLAGFLAGKKIKSKRFLWGLVVGSMYFFVLVILSLAVNHSFSESFKNFLLVMIMCVGSGMLGGMLSGK